MTRSEGVTIALVPDRCGSLPETEYIHGDSRFHEDSGEAERVFRRESAAFREQEVILARYLPAKSGSEMHVPDLCRETNRVSSGPVVLSPSGHGRSTPGSPRKIGKNRQAIFANGRPEPAHGIDGLISRP